MIDFALTAASEMSSSLMPVFGFLRVFLASPGMRVGGGVRLKGSKKDGFVANCSQCVLVKVEKVFLGSVFLTGKWEKLRSKIWWDLIWKSWLGVRGTLVKNFRKLLVHIFRKFWVEIFKKFLVEIFWNFFLKFYRIFSEKFLRISSWNCLKYLLEVFRNFSLKLYEISPWNFKKF